MPWSNFIVNVFRLPCFLLSTIFKEFGGILFQDASFLNSDTHWSNHKRKPLETPYARYYSCLINCMPRGMGKSTSIKIECNSHWLKQHVPGSTFYGRGEVAISIQELKNWVQEMLGPCEFQLLTKLSLIVYFVLGGAWRISKRTIWWKNKWGHNCRAVPKVIYYYTILFT